MSGTPRRWATLKKTLFLQAFLLPIMLFLGVMDARAQDADVSGTWEIRWETRLGETRSFTVDLSRDGDMVEGSAELPRGVFMEQAGEGMEDTGIMDGGAHGHVLTFKVRPETQSGMGDQVIAVYAAVVDEQMEGYLVGVMPEPETAVPFVGDKLY